MPSHERLPLIEQQSHPHLGELIEAVRAQRGGIFLNLYGALANSPEICTAWLQLFTAIRQKTSLPAKLRELVMLRVAVLNRAPYEFASHRPYALAAGITEQQLESLQAEQIDDTAFGQLERAVLVYTEAMTRQVQVEDAVFAPVRAAFNDQALLELTVTVAGYNMVSRVLEALQVPHDHVSEQR